MRVKTSELQGAALDWAVLKVHIMEPVFHVAEDGSALYRETDDSDDWVQYKPTTDWSQGGPIIEREKIGLWWVPSSVGAFGVDYGSYWYAEDVDGNNEYRAETPLIAAMRCYVASKLGDEIDVPEDLL